MHVCVCMGVCKESQLWGRGIHVSKNSAHFNKIENDLIPKRFEDFKRENDMVWFPLKVRLFIKCNFWIGPPIFCQHSAIKKWGLQCFPWKACYCMSQWSAVGIKVCNSRDLFSGDTGPSQWLSWHSPSWDWSPEEAPLGNQLLWCLAQEPEMELKKPPIESSPQPFKSSCLRPQIAWNTDQKNKSSLHPFIMLTYIILYNPI